MMTAAAIREDIALLRRTTAQNVEVYSVGTSKFDEEIASAIATQKDFVSDGFVSIAFENPGSLVINDRNTQTVYAFADITGIFPLFWTIFRDRICISARLTEIGDWLSAEIDDVGVIEFLQDGYCVGTRTVFKGIQRLRPGESIRFTVKTQKTASRDQSPLWSQAPSSLNTKKLLDTAVDLLRYSCVQMENSMLMMSGGWDSRTLLAGVLATPIGNTVNLYFHGDTCSREARIAAAIAELVSLPLTRWQIDATAFSVDFVEQGFRHYENVIFPHWHQAAISANQLGSRVQSVTAGIFGEILGGHYGPPFLHSGFGKVASTLWYLTGSRIFKSLEPAAKSAKSDAAMKLLGQPPYSKYWCITDEFWHSRFERIHEGVNDDISASVDRYLQRGITSQEGLVEAFITEHRGSQYVAAQLRSASTLKPLVAPFALRSLLNFACSVPFALKANNSLNRAIIRKLYPQLLNFSTAAVLCRTKRPIVCQESTRALRKILVDGGWKIRQTTKGRIPLYHWGWVNFQFLQDSRALFEVAESLKAPLWDKKAILARIEANRFRSYHVMNDMLMKMKTLDLMGVTRISSG